VIQSSTDLTNWAAVSTNRSTAATRFIELSVSEQESFFRVFRMREPLFTDALVALNSVVLDGVSTDSFDSRDPNYSTGGRYDVLKRKDNGNVAVSSSLPGALDIGNSRIMRRVSSGPDGHVRLGPNGSVGSQSWY
jgi:hypothetical protein